MRGQLKAGELADSVFLGPATAAPVFAGPAGTELSLSSLNRTIGHHGSCLHTAVWICNPPRSIVLEIVHPLPCGSWAPPSVVSKIPDTIPPATWSDRDAGAPVLPGHLRRGAVIRWSRTMVAAGRGPTNTNGTSSDPSGIGSVMSREPARGVRQ